MGIVRPTMEIYPWSWVFFVPFIIITSFAVLNLFIGIIVDAMQMTQHDTHEDDGAGSEVAASDQTRQLHDQLARLEREFATLKELLRKNRSERDPP